jgi:NhaP-type Na+/H+ or K+/H+ antiporter
VQLIIGVLFISISAAVTPQSLRHLQPPMLALVAVLVLAARPIAAFAATLRTDLTKGERAFIAWMAPRGIVAAATASTFAAALVAKGIGGAAKILPATFVVIVATVTLYGLTAVAAGRRLGVSRPARTRPLLVGGAARGHRTGTSPPVRGPEGSGVGATLYKTRSPHRQVSHHDLVKSGLNEPYELAAPRGLKTIASPRRTAAA